MSSEIVLNSSLIQSYTYEAETQTLQVTYKSNGAVFNYKPVSQGQIDAVFNSGGSAGSLFHKIIKRSGIKATEAD